MSFLPVLALALLAGCASSLPTVDESKLPPVPAAFRDSVALGAPAAAQPGAQWWKAFADPVLDDLVARAEGANSSIRVAAARLAQARAVARATDAARAADRRGRKRPARAGHGQWQPAGAGAQCVRRRRRFLL